MFTATVEADKEAGSMFMVKLEAKEEAWSMFMAELEGEEEAGSVFDWHADEGWLFSEGLLEP